MFSFWNTSNKTIFDSMKYKMFCNWQKSQYLFQLKYLLFIRIFILLNYIILNENKHYLSIIEDKVTIEKTVGMIIWFERVLSQATQYSFCLKAGFEVVSYFKSINYSQTSHTCSIAVIIKYFPDLCTSEFQIKILKKDYIIVI